jgi:hypothetical protein
VKRYDHSEKDDCRGMVSNDEDGDWVRWEDAAALEKRLAEATALLKRCSDEMAYDEFDDPAQRVLEHDVKAFLSATPSPPTEPAPSLVEQIEAIVVEWEDEFDSLNAMSRIQDLLRAAREAGGR